MSTAVKYEIIRRYIEESLRLDFKSFLVIMNIIVYWALSEFICSDIIENNINTNDQDAYLLLFGSLIAFPFLFIFMAYDKFRETRILKNANKFAHSELEIKKGVLNSIGKPNKDNKREQLAQIGRVDGIVCYTLLNNAKVSIDNIGDEYKYVELSNKINLFFNDNMENLIDNAYGDVSTEELYDLARDGTRAKDKKKDEELREKADPYWSELIADNYENEFKRKYGMFLIRCEIIVVICGIVSYILLKYMNFFENIGISELRGALVIGIPTVACWMAIELIRYINIDRKKKDLLNGGYSIISCLIESYYDKFELDINGDLKVVKMVLANGLKCRPLLTMDVDAFDSNDINKGIKIIATYNGIMFYITDEMEKVIQNRIKIKTEGIIENEES